MPKYEKQSNESFASNLCIVSHDKSPNKIYLKRTATGTTWAFQKKISFCEHGICALLFAILYIVSLEKNAQLLWEYSKNLHISPHSLRTVGTGRTSNHIVVMIKDIDEWLFLLWYISNRTHANSLFILAQEFSFRC